MTRPYGQMTADETNKFQTLIANYRAMRKKIWEAVEACRLFNAEVHAMESLGGELEAPAEPIPYDSRQGEKSLFASDPSWNGLINEHAFADAFVTEQAVTLLALNRAAVGADVAY